jgi:hypothetical protein
LSRSLGCSLRALSLSTPLSLFSWRGHFAKAAPEKYAAGEWAVNSTNKYHRGTSLQPPAARGNAKHQPKQTQMKCTLFACYCWRSRSPISCEIKFAQKKRKNSAFPFCPVQSAFCIHFVDENAFAKAHIAVAPCKNFRKLASDYMTQFKT